MPDEQGFEAYRPLMLSIAYRMLGSMTEAEDIVQEAYIRYQGAAPEQIWSHKAYLSTIVTRLCLNQLQSARSRRETYIGPWLPEPVLTQPDDRLDPAREAERAESISIAFLTLLEELTPVERAVFLLREVFDFDYSEVAEIVGKEEAACRQMASRAKKHIAAHRARFKADPDLHRRMLDRFVAAVSTGDLDGLMALLAEDVTMWTDGGGKARGAATQPLHGREAVAKFIASSSRQPGSGSLKPELSEVNGEPALIVRQDGQPRLVMTFVADGDHIGEVRVIGNPDKLNHVKRQE